MLSKTKVAALPIPFGNDTVKKKKKSRVVGIKCKNNTVRLSVRHCWINRSTHCFGIRDFFLLFFSSFYSKSKNILYKFLCAVHWLSHANIIKHKSIVIVRQTFDIIWLNEFWNLPLNFIDHVENRILSIERIFTNPEQSYVFAIYKSTRITILIWITKAIHTQPNNHAERHRTWTLNIATNAHVFLCCWMILSSGIRNQSW